MASQRKYSRGAIPGAVGHSIVGGVPGGSHYEIYKFSRHTGHGRANAGVKAGVVGSIPGAGTVVGSVAGAIRGYTKHAIPNHPNQANAKTGVRTSTPEPTRTKGRVGGK